MSEQPLICHLERPASCASPTSTIRGRFVRAMLRLIVAVGGLAFASAPAEAQNHPFGSHPFSYVAGTIQPNHVSGAAMDQAARDFYDAWKAAYVEQGCGTGRAYVRASIQGGNLTVSEAHGYGMIVSALMAGHDPDAKATFDGMYAYFRDHPSGFHANLMSWYQTKSCSNAQGNDSASDGDLDIAFALLLADKQWGSCGAVDYLAEAQAVIADIKAGELDTAAEYVLLGDWVTPAETTYYPASRASDWMTDHFRSFEAATGDADWTDVVDRAYQVIAAVQASHSPATGLLPDFVEDPVGTPHPVAGGFLEGPDDDAYNFNACRVPWRIGTDYLVSGDVRAKTALQAINAWIQAETAGDPGQIKSGYELDGSLSVGADFQHMCFIAPMAVGAMVDVGNQAWLNSLWDAVVANPNADEYYGDSIKLLTMLVLSSNWWVPEAVSGGCTPSGTALCTNPGSFFETRLDARGILDASGNESLSFRSKLFFPQGIPVVGDLSVGMQLLIEDLGAGASSFFDLTAATTPIPSEAGGVCGPGDGWKVRPKTTLYKNRSLALDPPTCTPDSSPGKVKLRYKQRSPRDLDIRFKVSRASLSTLVGPVRATLILGDTAAAGSAGACGVAESLPCGTKGSGLRCE